MNEFLDQLHRKHLVWHGSEKKAAADTLPSGYPELDTHLNGGFPQRGVIDIQSPQGIGELRLLLPSLQEQKRLTVFINPPAHVCAEHLYHLGFDLRSVLLIFVKGDKEGLWASEQCLKSGACSAVILWQEEVEVAQVKRLQLGSETGNAMQFLLRSSKKDHISLPVSLGVHLTPAINGLEVAIKKRKGGWPLPPFKLDMCKRWPALTLHRPENVIPFRTAKAI